MDMTFCQWVVFCFTDKYYVRRQYAQLGKHFIALGHSLNAEIRTKE
jgi:hypothetical protein